MFCLKTNERVYWFFWHIFYFVARKYHQKMCNSNSHGFIKPDCITFVDAPSLEHLWARMREYQSSSSSPHLHDRSCVTPRLRLRWYNVSRHFRHRSRRSRGTRARDTWHGKWKHPLISYNILLKLYNWNLLENTYCQIFHFQMLKMNLYHGYWTKNTTIIEQWQYTRRGRDT